jgi:predicted dinucleotide-binding enzyme
MLNKKIGVLGSGAVGETLADGFLKYGCTVMRGSREPAKLADWQKKAGAKASIGTFAETAAFGELIVLAVKGKAASSIVEALGSALDGKVVLDTTNPLAEKPPVDGMLEVFTGPNESLIERLQKQAPKARFVKAFSCVGAVNMVDPAFDGVKPTMFICGDDKSAKADTRAVLDAFGWEVEDLGSVRGGRAIEPLCITWCAPGFLEGRWTHAFKVLKR